ncbi:IS3 family transposase [uncultured Ilyobacter sp.]|uniref:IS3 family transposase n=1 Tax=uncultured Ilyobacter sp. TaxID=544433 RepID=UPI0029F4DE5F|nr:IS3 family transposase [uncultured Ilyobacter sp.]
MTTLSKVHPIYKLTKILNIPKSTYYYRISSTENPNKLKREDLKRKIFKIWDGSHKRYGAPKIHQELLKESNKCSLKHVQNLMTEQSIMSITVKKFKPQRGNEAVEEKSGPNISNQDFSVEKINEKVVGDITYIHTKKDKWCYLSSFMDLYNNEIIGWSFSKNMTTDMVLESLKMACIKRKDIKGAIIHTDRGSQYTSNAFKETVKSEGMRLSYSRKGNPYDNACIESFHSVLKKELIHHKVYEDFEEAMTDIIEYIENWYNNRRIQKKLGWKSPREYLKAA